MIALGKTAVFASIILGSCFNPLAAQEAPGDVAFVETVTGRAVALVSGRPTLLGPLDVITNQTRVDVLANSELRLCHYQTSRFLTVKGPARIIVAGDGVSVEAGKAVVSSETCGVVEASAHPGGIVARGSQQVASPAPPGSRSGAGALASARASEPVAGPVSARRPARLPISRAPLTQPCSRVDPLRC